MTEVTTIGLDIAKHVFHAHGADGAGRAMFRRLPPPARAAFMRLNDRAHDPAAARIGQRFLVQSHADPADQAAAG